MSGTEKDNIFLSSDTNEKNLTKGEKGRRSSSSSTTSRESTNIHDVISFTETEIGAKDQIITQILSPSGKEVNVTGDVDDAMKLALEAKDLQVTPEEDRKLLRKIDFYIFPLICLLYAIQFMDKVTNGNAAIMGLRTDLKMHGTEYSWVGSAFYFGYLGGLFVIPPLLQKSPWFMKSVSIIVILWGMVLACHAAPSVNYASFIFLRCLLGFLESAITPSFTILMCQYWKQDEQFVRICFWFGCNGLGGILSSSISYGLFIHSASYSMKAWRVLFVITGMMTIFTGLLMLLHIPDNPSKAWFLNAREKLMVIQRIKSNQQGYGNHHIKKYQIIEAFKDIRTWLYFLFSVCSQIPNGGMTNFFSILLNESFKFDTKKSLLMNMPGDGVELGGCPLFGLLCVYFAYKKFRHFKWLGHSLVWGFIANNLVIVGTCMLAFADKSKKARLAGAYIWFILPVAFICTLSNISSNTCGYTKKWTVSSINLMAYCAANIAGPQTFIAKQAPNYNGAKIAMVVCSCVGSVILALLYIINVRENKKRDKVAAERGPERVVENLEFADLTDFENPHFRYAL
ncbi:probable Allantoate permease [Saccharomycodes ludwigii]|uniref:Probable Allantoate permease n=1 Tax=Saccharomycodes ludwigii TaxID=36035 RepID=A0A376B8B1_9ASCO|nr:hypothetical protein SCDLUD_004299 [Saccharomycodes ludwigii]KAH3899982.1 hypothetical protein SCDLUD_004299 [Saccharomycodes ludwigii]SSD60380.1 probable Allantoate permease [Saccharomycodes ludwigii]